MTVYDFPHFKTFESWYNCLAALLGSMFDWKPSYVTDLMLSAFMQAFVFFIVAIRYDKNFAGTKILP